MYWYQREAFLDQQLESTDFVRIYVWGKKIKKIGIYIYVRGEGGLGSEKIWGATVDKWEGKIGAKFLS